MHFLQHAVLDDGDAGLARGDIDENFFGHAITPEWLCRPYSRAERQRTDWTNAARTLRKPTLRRARLATGHHAPPNQRAGLHRVH